MPWILKKLSHLSCLEKTCKAGARVEEKACNYKHGVLNCLDKSEDCVLGE